MALRLLQSFSGIYAYRDLVLTLTISDLKLRYKNSALGFLWTLVNPLLMTAILWVVFVQVFKTPTPNFHVFLLIGLVAWRFFALGTSASMLNLIGKSSLVKKIYFPREILVFSSALYALASGTLEFLAVFFVMAISGIPFSFNIAFLPVILFLEFLLVYSLALWLSALNVYWRDTANIWEVVLSAGFFATPIFYSREFIPSQYHFLVDVNPMAHLVELYRDVLLYANTPKLLPLAIVLASSLALLFFGWRVFSKLEPNFAEKL